MNPLLPALVLLPAAAAVLLALLPARAARDPLRFAAWVAGAVLVLALAAFLRFDPADPRPQFSCARAWFRAGEVEARWALGLDGISLLLVLLTALLGPIMLVSARGHVATRTREFAVLALAMESGMLGVFCALDLVLFYVFWEVALVPLYFVIGIWGGERREIATLKFVLYTLAGSLVLLVALLAVALETRTTDIEEIARRDLPADLERLAFLGFAIGFAVKVPLVPFHTWLPDAHVEAPTSGSVVLAGVLLKMGTYGLLRFCIPLFPRAAAEFAPFLALLGAVGVVYGGLLAWAQRDLKRLVAYSSISHLGLVVVGLFALEPSAARGALYHMFNHGISTGALFLLVGVLYDRTHRRGIADFGGLARPMPLFAALATLAALASAGLPGTNGFVGEFLVLAGAFRTDPLAAVAATSGVILSAIYLLGALRSVLYGSVAHPEHETLPDCRRREIAVLLPLAASMVLLGLFPRPFLDRIGPAVDRALFSARAAAAALEAGAR